MRFLGYILVGLAFLIPSLVAAPSYAQKSTVGIIVTDAVNLTDAEALEITSGLAAAMEQTVQVSTVAGSLAKSRLPENGIDAACLADAECLRGVGERVDVEQLLMLVIVKVGDRVQVDVTWVQISDGKSSSRDPFSYEGGQAEAKKAFLAYAPLALPGVDKIKRREQKTVVIQDDRPIADSKSGGLGTGFWVASTSAVVLGVGAAVFGSMSLSKENEWKDCIDLQEGGCSLAEADSLNSDADTLALVSDLMWGGAAVSGGLAIYFLLTHDSDDEPSERGVSLGSGPGDIGMSLSGRF